MKHLSLSILIILLAAVPARAEVLEVATTVYCPLACPAGESPRDAVMHEILRRSFEDSGFTRRTTTCPTSGPSRRPWTGCRT